MSSPAPAPQAALEVHPISPALGVEVIGLDVSRPLDDETLGLVKQLFETHHLLCFRDQHLSPEQQIAFSRQFGELEPFPEADKTKEAPVVYHVANVSTDGVLLGSRHVQSIYQKVNARWHTDSSYRAIPSLASIMYGIEVMPEDAQGGETEFSNMFAAYDALSDEMKHRLEPLHMVHYYEFGRRLFEELPPVPHAERSLVPPVTHPVIRVHPDRGNRRSLFFTTNAGNEIGGMSLEDGQALHRKLASHVSRPEFCYKHRWRAGDLVMWDNRCLLHRARGYDMDRYRRVFRRTTVAGAGPIRGPFSRD
jgi:taurine dioxygenase/alpha-ketoglutarate-dependent 2,4-dichlorophenoxyacetate dioxygenase